MLFTKAKEKEMPLSRVHLHPYGGFIMCYDTNKWHDAQDAIIKSSMTLLKYCLRDSNGVTPDNWMSSSENFSIPAIQKEIDLSSLNKESIKVSSDKLMYSFDLNDEGIHCNLQFFIKCLKPSKTAGMGDTISGTGFIYHEPK